MSGPHQLVGARRASNTGELSQTSENSGTSANASRSFRRQSAVDQ